MVSINMEQTGRHIRALMAENGLNVKQVGEIMGLEYQTAYAWCHGRNLPNAEHLIELSDLLGVPIEEILVFERR